MLHRLADAEALPVESDAPDSAGEIPYDAALQADLMEYGPEALTLYGKIVVRDVGNPARYNAAVWYALAQEPPLHYEYDGQTITITERAP